MSGDPSFQIDVSFRNFKFTRGYAVKETQDVLTELLTNACDAYTSLDPDNLMDKIIYILFHRVRNSLGGYDNYLQVIDNATGVSPDRMKNCFLVAGNKTSSEQSRGFFSTGAKNITIMGDVHYTSVKDGVLSKVYLDDEVYGHIVTHGPYDPNDPTVIPDVVGVPVTDVQREILGIPLNGMNVVLKYTNDNETKKFTDFNIIDKMLTDLSKVATLRDIFSNPKITVIKDIRSYEPYIDILNTNSYVQPIIHTNSSIYDRSIISGNFGGAYYGRIIYTYPVGRLLLSTTFTVPNYPQYTAKFVMYKTDVPIPQPEKETCMEFGFLIKDSKAVHEVNTLEPNDRYRWNPNVNYIYGYVSCNGFSEELKKYDSGLTNELILDPNRVGGINHTHSLYTSILSFCLPRFEKALLDIQQEASFQSINIQDLDSIINKLEELGLDLFDTNTVTVNYTQDNTGELIIAIKQTETNVISEIYGSINVDIKASDDATIEDIQMHQLKEGLSGNRIYYISDTNELKHVDAPIDLEGPLYTDEIHRIVENIDDINVQKPHIYTLQGGVWEKGNIYKRGKILTKPEFNSVPLDLVKKTLSIQFINDINYQERYILDTSNGIKIKINLHNVLVASKLSKVKINEKCCISDFDLSSNASYDALQFLETLMIDAFTDILVESDSKKGKIILTDTVSAPLKVLDYWTKICVQIEPTVRALFMEYITKKRSEMRNNVAKSVEVAKNKILELFSRPESTIEDVEIGATMLANTINTTISSIL